MAIKTNEGKTRKLANFLGKTRKLQNNSFKGDTVVCFALTYNIYSNRNENTGYILTFSLFLSLSLCLLINIQFYYICNFHFIKIVLRSNNHQHLQQYHHLLCGIVSQWQYCITIIYLWGKYLQLIKLFNVNNNYLRLIKTFTVNRIIYR